MTEQQSLHSDVAENSPQAHEDQWRDEITARVAGYRHRRGRRVEGAFSMRFSFPPAEEESVAPAPEEQVSESFEIGSTQRDESDHDFAHVLPSADPTDLLSEPTHKITIAAEEPQRAIEDAVSVAVIPEDEEAMEAEPALVAPVPRPRGKRKVIAFPRQASSAPESYRLADPVIPEQPRILDVPEELEAFPTTPLLDGLQFGPAQQSAQAISADYVELPCEPVGISRRVYAGLIDWVLVAAGAAVFGAVSYRMLPTLAITKPVILAGAAALILLWTVYQYIFTMYAGATPGMRTLHIRLATFKGGWLKWRHRRSRVAGLYFSSASLAMGLLWSLVDVDGLCWHDRTSRTYPIRTE
jgi:uncharacterized RDD family membrane protein YckC